jgi:phosphatidate cytidylyltransferase
MRERARSANAAACSNNESPQPSMKRLLTAAVAIPLLVVLIVFAPLWLLALVVGLFSALAVEEFFSLAEKQGIGRPGRWFLLPVAGVPVSFLWGFGWVLSAVVIAVLLLMTASIFAGSLQTALGRIGMGLGSIVYCPLMLGFFVIMPRERILLLLTIIWIGDTAAYYGGRALGRHLLAPKVSPKKTVEGAIAGLVGSLIAGAVGGTWFLHEPLPSLILISVITAIAGQLGDLAESVLKRSAGVKDSSSIMPGHGGILDRLDSLFFATPVFYWFFMT